MSHIFLAVNGDDVGEHIGNAIANDDHHNLAKISSSIKSAHDMLDKWVESRGGKIVVSSGDEGVYSIPQQYLQEIETIKNRYNKMTGTTLTIGVGSSMSEASKALIYGKMNDKNQVVHYEQGIEDYISGEEEELPSEEDIQEDSSNFNRESQGTEDSEEMEDESEMEDEEGLEEVDDESEEMDGEIEDEEVSEEDEESEASASMPLDEAIDEHEDLVDTLESENEEDDEQELEEQSEELSQFKNKKKKLDSEEMEEPEHEEGVSEEEDFIHDAQENQDDEQDVDDIEADQEEEVFGRQTEPSSEEVDDESEEMDGAEGSDLYNEDNEIEDEEMSEDEIPDLSEDDILSDKEPEEMEDEEMSEEDSQDMDSDDHNGVLSEMLHANMGAEGEDDMSPEGEQAEDSDDEIKQDIIESLMSFRQNKTHLEEMKQTNPELYQANILMLRSMIQLAKKFGLNPEQSYEDASQVQDMESQFPMADEEMEQEQPDELVEIGKAEKGINKPYFDAKHKHQGKANKGTSEAGWRAKLGSKLNSSRYEDGEIRPDSDRKKKFKQQAIESSKNKHRQVLSEMKEIKPNLPKSEHGVDGINRPFHERGVNPTVTVGQKVKDGKLSGRYYEHSTAGNRVRRGDKEGAKRAHKEIISEMKQMKKPNLPKSEDMDKAERPYGYHEKNRKIDIHHKGKYHHSTKWASNLKQAKESHLKKYPDHKPEEVKAYFSEPKNKVKKSEEKPDLKKQ